MSRRSQVPVRSARGRVGGLGLVVLGLAAAAAPSALAQDVAARLDTCAQCHGTDGNATLPNVPSLAAQPKVFLENQLVVIREGLREIPAMKGVLDGVSDAEISAIAVHYSALPARSAAAGRDPATYDRGRQLAESLRCGSCHLPDYRGREQMPRLAGQREDYLFYTMRLLQTNQATGRDTIMAASLYGIAEPDLRAMAHFLAHLGP